MIFLRLSDRPISVPSTSMKKLSCLGLFGLVLTVLPAAETVWLGQAIDARMADDEFTRPRPVTGRSATGKPLQIAGQPYDQGVGTQLETTIGLAVNGAVRFTALAGVDDATSRVRGRSRPMDPATARFWGGCSANIPSPPMMRDLWRQQDLALNTEGLSLALPRHRTALSACGRRRTLV